MKWTAAVVGLIIAFLIGTTTKAETIKYDTLCFTTFEALRYSVDSTSAVRDTVRCGDDITIFCREFAGDRYVRLVRRKVHDDYDSCGNRLGTKTTVTPGLWEVKYKLKEVQP